MVDKELIEKLKKMRDSGGAGANKEDVLELFKIFSQLAEEDEELKEEVEESDLCLMFVMTDEDFKFWIEARNGKISYGEGDGPDVSVTISATREILSGMLSREIDATSAYMAGDLTIDGNLQDAMAFSEIAEIAGELIEDLMEE